MKPTLETLFGMSNEQLVALSDAELDLYLADALTVQPQVDEITQQAGVTRINTASARPRTGKSPSALARQLAEQALEGEIDQEILAIQAEAVAASAARKLTRARA